METAVFFYTARRGRGRVHYMAVGKRLGSCLEAAGKLKIENGKLKVGNGRIRADMGKAKTRYREIRRVCGDYMYVYVFPVFFAGEYMTAGGKRRKKYRPSSEVQQGLNDRHSARRFRELVHTNFCSEDYCLHLSYEDGWLAEDDETAEKDLDAMIRRLKRLYAKHGAEFKYMAVTARGESRGRYHHHLIISGGVDRDLVCAKWAYGFANCDRLQFNETGVADLSAYIVERQNRVSVRRWKASKNLCQPVEKPVRDHVYNRRLANEMAEAPFASPRLSELYPGYVLAEYPERVDNCVNGGVYLAMTFFKEDADFMQRRRGTGKYKKSGGRAARGRKLSEFEKARGKLKIEN